MAILVRTSNPQKLLDTVNKDIDNKKIISWLYDSDKDYTLSGIKWQNKAWIRPKVTEDNFSFNIVFCFIGNNKIVTSKTCYAFFHCHFSEMLLSLYDTEIEYLEITSMPKLGYDNITTEKNVKN